jgi:flavin reductase (DIM6/NTAB) family NADH-FMN oxidoreductase RutF
MSVPAADKNALKTGEEGKPGRVYDPKDFRNALGCFCTGVTVITAASSDGRRAGLTANSFSSVSLNPPLVLWNLYIHSRSMPVFQEASHFCVNVLNAGQESLARHFARHSDDKFAEVEWQPGLGGAPMLAGAIARFQCRNSQRYYGGDHVIFLGAVEEYTHGSGEPLLFSRGAFRSFADPSS